MVWGARIAFLIVIVVQLGLLTRTDDRFLERPHIEDAYYAFSVARSFSEGNGFSVDGIEPTNGVQPLVCLLYAPLFSISPDDPVAPLRLILFLNILIGVVGALLFGRFLKDVCHSSNTFQESSVGLVGSTLFLANYSLLTHLLNGLETGLTLLLLLLTTIIWNRVKPGGRSEAESVRPYVVVGFLVGVTVLSRIDAVFLVPVLVLDYYFSARKSGARSPLWKTVQVGSTLGGTAFLCSLPWWLYNLSISGSVLPVSGLSQVDLAPSFWSVLSASLSVLFDSMMPGIHTPEGWDVMGLSLFGLVVPLGLWTAYLLSGEDGAFRLTMRTWMESIQLNKLSPLLLYVGVLFIAYTFFFSAPHFQERYLVLIRVLGVVGWSTLFLAFFGSVRVRRTKTWGVAWGIGVSIVGLNLLLTHRFYNGSYNNPLLQTVEWIDQNTMPGTSIGVFQSGTPEYFFPRRVTNLDGKVNVGAHRAYRSGQLGSYVDSMAFDYLVDWTLYTDRVFSDVSVADRYRAVDTLANNMIVWQRRERTQ